MADDAELVIAGAGLTGMLLGIACAGAGLQVAVVDPQDPAAMLTPGFDGRTSAIAYGSRLVFDGIGLWPAIGGYLFHSWAWAVSVSVSRAGG